jgi:hypothetical protein
MSLPVLASKAKKMSCGAGTAECIKIIAKITLVNAQKTAVKTKKCL